MMPIRGLGRVRRRANLIRNKFASRLVILLYHRVVDSSSPDPFSLCVTPQHFAEHLEVLKKYGPVVSLEKLVQALQLGNLPRRAVAITLDDGYADNLLHAKPLLDRYDTPATVFVVTGYLGRQREFWWDELERLVLSPGTLPETLRLTATGSPYERQLGNAAHYSHEDHLRNHSWRAGHDNSGPRQLLYRSLYQLLNPMPDGRRREALDELQTWSGAEPIVRSTHRPLLAHEVVRLSDRGLVEIGVHTVTHPSLEKLPAPEQRNEIHTSKTRLEEILGRPVTSFAYPFGHNHYTAETKAMVQEAEFHSACSTFSTAVSKRTDCFELPRLTVRDYDGQTLENNLREWFRG